MSDLSWVELDSFVMLKVLHICLPLLFGVAPTRPSGHFHFDLEPTVDILGKQSAACLLNTLRGHVESRSPSPPLFPAWGCTTYRILGVIAQKAFFVQKFGCLAPHRYNIMGR